MVRSYCATVNIVPQEKVAFDDAITEHEKAKLLSRENPFRDLLQPPRSRLFRQLARSSYFVFETFALADDEEFRAETPEPVTSY